MSTIKSQDKLQTFQASDLQTLLSATLTNLDTCLDGIRAADSSSNVINSLVAPLLNGTKYCSVSLALFAKVATLDLSRGLPLAMSAQDRRVFESFGEMKIAETGGGGVSVSKMVVVNKKKGVGNFTTINDAIDSAPNSTADSVPGHSYYVIYVTEGYYEKKHNLMIIGDGIGKTTITGNRSVVDGWTTFNSSTFSVVAPGFVAVGITFKNTAGPAKRQAVAVSAAAVLQNCRIMSRLPMIHQFNAITAQGRTDPNQNTGISIQNCSIKAAKDLAESNGTTRSYLGRPWKAYSRTVVMNSYIASFLDPAGWSPWFGNDSLSTLYYAEFNNSGIGARTGGRVDWPGFRLINETEAGNFTVANFTQGDVWLPATGVPFVTGLVQ
ncbi:Probable pectinesterase/pectinesterase inhibitor 41 [Linum perenne]